MSAKKSVRHRIVGRLREFTESLERSEVVSERFTCRKVVLNLKPSRYNPELVRKTRKLLGVSQALFARFLGVSPQTVRAWEQDVNVPNDMACRFMDEIRLDPQYWVSRFKKLAVSKSLRKSN